MAKVHLNSALNNISGCLGSHVYRRYRKKTVLQRRPVFTQPWSAAQKETRATFGGGSAYAEKIKADPVLRELYKERGRRRLLNYRHMAIRDFFNPPTVGDLDTTGYKAPTGGVLVVHATDDFEVVRVHFALSNAAGADVFAGDATPDGISWRFTAPPPAPGVAAPVTVVVTAYDRPGNATERKFPLPA
jgi:hypothetical protein